MAVILTCSHGMPSPASCTLCMEDGPVAPPTRHEPAGVVATFTARYEGECWGCDLPIHVGQVVHVLTDDRYVHEGCQ